VGFEYHNIPRYVQFADDRYRDRGRGEGEPDFTADPSLFWRIRPNNPRLLTNARGFRGADFAEVKPAGTVRIISLGCSCTFGISSACSYPEALAEFLGRNEAAPLSHRQVGPPLDVDPEARPLAPDLPGKRFEVINAGVPGYSSLQGLRLLESEMAGYRPDIVTVFFGWNDHWLARSFPDREQKAPSRGAQFLLDHASRSRLFQALVKLSASVRRLARGRRASETYRVSPVDYRGNLERMIDDAERGGFRIVLVTAPAAYQQAADVPDYLVQDRFIPDKTTLLTLHREYNEIVRQVARRRGVPLADCAATFDASPRRKGLFGEDGIHPNEIGHWLIARDLFRVLRDQGWIPRRGYDPEDDLARGFGLGRPESRP
jgi:lysophospholipase L1-like esterase